jgi:hypothetical protein
MTHDVFISYSNKDKPIADGICANLESAGVRCWIAPRDIAPGEDWPSAITRAISQSRIMVLVFSANSNSSEDVGRELMLAANNKLVIIPFKIENIEPEPGKQYYLARMHWLDAINPPTQEQINTLIERVKALIPVGARAHLETPPVAIPNVYQPTRGIEQPRPVPRKQANRLRYLWIPAVSILLLGMIGWGILTFVTHTLPSPLLAQATATYTKLASTAKPTTSPTAIKTPTNKRFPTYTPLPPAPTKLTRLLMRDGLSSNQNGWVTWNKTNDGCSTNGLFFYNGEMVWQVDGLYDHSCYYLSYLDSTYVSDFDVSIDVEQTSGFDSSDVGLAFRVVDEQNFYTFSVDNINQMFFVKMSYKSIGIKTLRYSIEVKEIRPNAANRLAISARGSQFTFLINDKVVAVLYDTNFSSGSIGLFANVTSGADITAKNSNFELYTR